MRLTVVTGSSQPSSACQTNASAASKSTRRAAAGAKRSSASAIRFKIDSCSLSAIGKPTVQAGATLSPGGEGVNHSG